MKVLVACEFSGIVRRQFAQLGHDAWSCDLLPADDNQHNHYQCDVLKILNDGWDLMIAHPPCTYLANSGVRWLFGGKGKIRDGERWREMERAAEFFLQLLNAPIPKIAVENPIPHCYALEIIGQKYTQIIQPWEHGHGETKATCLWLKNLSPLKPSKIVEGRTPRVHRCSPGPNRWKERSRTLIGIAKAMAGENKSAGNHISDHPHHVVPDRNDYLLSGVPAANPRFAARAP